MSPRPRPPSSRTRTTPFAARQTREDKIPEFRDFHISDLHCAGAATAISITGLPQMPVHSIWFDNVENGAAAIVGQETVQYVRNIYKYYVSYAPLRQGSAANATAEPSQR